jgi:hypothetical protein
MRAVGDSRRTRRHTTAAAATTTTRTNEYPPLATLTSRRPPARPFLGSFVACKPPPPPATTTTQVAAATFPPARRTHQHSRPGAVSPDMPLWPAGVAESGRAPRQACHSDLRRDTTAKANFDAAAAERKFKHRRRFRRRRRRPRTRQAFVRFVGVVSSHQAASISAALCLVFAHDRCLFRARWAAAACCMRTRFACFRLAHVCPVAASCSPPAE